MNELVWSICGMILTGETEVLEEKYCKSWVIDIWKSIEQWCNDNDMGNWISARKHYKAWVVNEWLWSSNGMILTWETEFLLENIIKLGW